MDQIDDKTLRMSQQMLSSSQMGSKDVPVADNSKDMNINESGKVGGDDSKDVDWERKNNTSPEMGSVTASQNEDAYTIALIKTEMEKKLGEFKKTIVDEAVFAA